MVDEIVGDDWSVMAQGWRRSEAPGRVEIKATVGYFRYIPVEDRRRYIGCQPVSEIEETPFGNGVKRLALVNTGKLKY